MSNKQIGARLFLWSLLFSTSSYLLQGLSESATGPNSKIVVGYLVFALIPLSAIIFAYFTIKNGDRAEYLIFGRLLSETKPIGGKHYET